MNDHIVDEWIKACRLGERYEFLQKYPLDDRVLRLFAVACCREIRDKFTDKRSRKAVEIAELYADGLASKKELRKAYNDAWDATSAAYSAAYYYAVSAAYSAAYYAASVSAASAAYYAAGQYKRQGLILVSMCPTNFNNDWINTTTKSLAKQIYDNKDFSLMPILADALQDADCNEEILEHLRSKGPFYKGNYIIDVLTGKRTTEASIS